MRKEMILLHNKKNLTIHFGLMPNDTIWRDVWIPIRGPLFEAVEEFMVLNSVASNVTTLEYVRTCGECDDYLITYNEHTS
ncbi:MAG: hypothetical protein ACUZ8H_13995 [Candidatus Anammoxibacter sp.]